MPPKPTPDPLAGDFPLPGPGWRLVSALGTHDGGNDPDISGCAGGAAYMRDDGLKVMRTKARYDGEWWIHVSLSRRNRLPSWGDMKLVKQMFLGDVLAIQSFPPMAEWVNVHPYCLHLWHCLDGTPIPSFLAKKHGVAGMQI